jgi:hypothetical protein
MLLAMILTSDRQPEHKVDNNRREQRNGQNSRAKSVIKAALSPHPYAPRAPVEGKERVYHGHHGNEGKEAGGDFANFVAKVEQADCETAEDDGEVEPRKESALVGEEDFGLDARGERDALAWHIMLADRQWIAVREGRTRRGLEERLGRHDDVAIAPQVLRRELLGLFACREGQLTGTKCSVAWYSFKRRRQVVQIA